MSSVDTRLTQLAAAIERRRLDAAQPIDGLSQSLDEFDKWLADLDPFGLADSLADEDGRQILTPKQARRMINGLLEK